MIKAIFYKEWIKTGKITIALVVIMAAFIVYTFLNTLQMFRMSDIHEVWTMMVTKDMGIIPSFIYWFILACGIAVASSQYSSEMTNKRLKLTLHLPLSEIKVVNAMYLYGVAVITAIYILAYISFAVFMSIYFPIELIIAMMLKLTPFVLGGYAAYFLTASVIVEPIWRRRVVMTIITVSLLSIYIIPGGSMSHIYNLWFLLVSALATICCATYSISRFKDGAQR